MSALSTIHHINFLYRDLGRAVARFERLGLGPFLYEDLEERGVRTARVELNGVWLVLVAPTKEDSVPGKYLERHGEGFFLLSFGVDALAEAVGALSNDGVPLGPVRSGVGGWRVADIDSTASFGVQLQIAEDPSAR